MTKKKINEEVYEVSFQITLKRDPDSLIMFPNEMRSCMKYWLELQFEDYFKKFKIKGFRCRRVRK